MSDFDNHIEENEKDYDLLALDLESDDNTIDSNEVEEEIELEDADTDTPEQLGEESSDAEESQGPQESLDDLEVKYLHEVKKLKDIPKEELKTLVQKGMNHDRLAEKVEGLKQLESKMSGFEELASFYGMSTDELKESLFNSYFENKADYDGVTPELLKREYAQDKKEQVDKDAEKTKAKQDQEMMDFIDKYPGVKGDDIEPETWDLVQNGMSITQAYEKQINNKEVATLKAKIAELEGKQKTNNQNAETKKKAVVKSTLSNGSDDPDKNDDFLQGLFGS